MLKLKIAIGILSVLLIASVTLNVLTTQASLGYFDDNYRDLAQTYIFNTEVLGLLKESDTEKAIELLTERSKSQAFFLGICFIEECSKGMVKVFQEHEVEMP